ncbi:MAG: hypothetical protein JWN85_893 [Gammaproteobacteria bacterium]|nr:hypothetical protein [Gammaproteobacteria bacterium]
MATYVIYERAQRRVQPPMQRHIPRGLVGLGCALLAIAGCSKLGLGGQDEMAWARAALERNDRIEIVAADQQASTFTVRLKDSGELRMIRVDQVVGGPPGMPRATQASGSAGSPAVTAPSLSPTAESSPETNSPAGLATSPSNNTLPARDEPASTPPANALPKELKSATTSADMERSANGDVAAAMPGGRVLESGPGYAIKAASKSAPASARAEREKSSTTSAAIERRHDPIICQGERLLQIDNRNLEFDGDAVTAEDGCEIHITNSHISAKGVGISARHANVHIENSQIEGDAASIDAAEGAQVYASSSKFKGMSRRLDNSSFHDLGGNVWN